MPVMVPRMLPELSEENIMKFAGVYHVYGNDDKYEHIVGFCKKVLTDDIEANDCALTPERYVGVKENESDSEPFEKKMGRLSFELSEQMKKSAELDTEIKNILGEIGYEI